MVSVQQARNHASAPKKQESWDWDEFHCYGAANRRALNKVDPFLESARVPRPLLRPGGRAGAPQHINHISDTFTIGRTEHRRRTAAGISHAAAVIYAAAAALNSMTWSAAILFGPPRERN